MRFADEYFANVERVGNMDDACILGVDQPHAWQCNIENVLVGLEFLGNVLPLSLTVTTGFQIIEGFGVIGQPIDEESGELILVSLAITPAGPLSPPIAIALTIEGILRGE